MTVHLSMRSVYPSTVCGNCTTSPSSDPASGFAGAVAIFTMPFSRSSVNAVVSSPNTQTFTVPLASMSPSSWKFVAVPSV